MRGWSLFQAYHMENGIPIKNPYICQITITSVMTYVILGTLLMLIICILVKSDCILRKAGPGFFIIASLGVGLRMIFPAEFPYTYSVYHDFTGIIDFMMFCPLKNSIRVWQILLIAWLLGSVWVAFTKMRNIKKWYALLQIIPEIFEDEISAIYEETFIEQYPEIRKMKFVKISRQGSPCLTGIKNPIIVLPDFKYTDEQLKYIVAHEIMHYRNHDIVIKILLEIITVLYWWNPVVYYLEKQIFEVIEIRNDQLVTQKMNVEEKNGYIECLFNVAKCQMKEKPVNTADFSRKDADLLKKRINMISKRDKILSKYRVPSYILLVIVCLLSTTIIFEPVHCSMENDGEEGIWLDENTGFLVRNHDVYDIYIQGKYVDTTEKNEDMTPYCTLKIYNNLKEGLKSETKK